MRKLIIDLNDYEKIEGISSADLLIQPAKIGNIQLAAIAYRLLVAPEKTSKAITVTQVIAGVKWSPECIIDVLCQPQDYLYLVKWWFENASTPANRFYVEGMERLYPTIDFRPALAKIRKDIESYHTYHTNTKGKFAARITSIDRKIRTILRTFESKNWYKK